MDTVVVLRRRIRPERSAAAHREPPFESAQALSVAIELTSPSVDSASESDETRRSPSSDSSSSNLQTSVCSLLAREPNWCRAALRVDPVASLPVARAASLQMKLRGSTQIRAFATGAVDDPVAVERRSLVSLVVLFQGGCVIDPGTHPDRGSIRGALEALARVDPARVVSCDVSSATIVGPPRTKRELRADFVEL